MNLLIDDIKTFREFQFKNSTSCSFSSGGHLLAAVSHNKIGIYSRLKDISTLKFSTPSVNNKSFKHELFNNEIFNPRPFSHELFHEIFNHELILIMLKPYIFHP
jgi:hypothetical protein